jgi:hypothetical protein
LYTEGEPAESLSEASVALTYGAYEVSADEVSAGEAVSDLSEHPVVARANRHVRPAAGLRNTRIFSCTALVMFVSGK